MLDLRDYLCRNQIALRNYAQDRRNGLRISSALAESAMSHLVNERMGKRQPMRCLRRAPTFSYRFVAPYSTIRLEMFFREWLPKLRRPTHPHYYCRPQLFYSSFSGESFAQKYRIHAILHLCHMRSRLGRVQDLVPRPLRA